MNNIFAIKAKNESMLEKRAYGTRGGRYVPICKSTLGQRKYGRNNSNNTKEAIYGGSKNTVNNK